jgi:hypothetical protein
VVRERKSTARPRFWNFYLPHHRNKYEYQKAAWPPSTERFKALHDRAAAAKEQIVLREFERALLLLR